MRYFPFQFPARASDSAASVSSTTWLRRGPEVGLLVLGLFLVFWRLGSAPLLDYDEALYVTCAQQMVVSGDMVTPRLNTRMPDRPGVTAIPFFEKPVLVYWASAGAMRLLGRNMWAARLPAALVALLTTWAVCLAGKRWFGRRAGLLAALTYMTAPMTLVDARQMTTDGLLVLWLTLAMLCFWKMEEERREEETRRQGDRETRRLISQSPIINRQSIIPSVLFWLLCALAVLTKGAVGLLLPFMIIGVFLLLNRLVFQIRLRTPSGPNLRFLLQLQPLSGAWKTAMGLRPLVGLLLFLLVAAPWHVLIARSGERDAQGRTWVQEYVVRQHIGRFKGLDTVHNAPLPTYVVYFLLGFFPWSCFAPAAFRQFHHTGKAEDGRWKTEGEEKEMAEEDDASDIRHPQSKKDTSCRLPSSVFRLSPSSFLLIWFWTVFIFFSLGAAKLPTYITPAYPPAALLMGRWLDRALKTKWGEKRSPGTVEDEDERRTGPSLRRGALSAVMIGLLMLAFIIIAPRYAPKGAPIPAMLLTIGRHIALTFVVGSGIAWGCFQKTAGYKSGRAWGMGALAAMMVVTLGILGGEGYDAVRDIVIGPYQQLAQAARTDADAGMPILYYNIVPRRPSMNFYAGYAPFEHKNEPDETRLLPFLATCLPPNYREADVIMTRDTYTRLLVPEIAATPGTTLRPLQQRGPNGDWILARVSVPAGYVPPLIPSHKALLWTPPSY